MVFYSGSAACLAPLHHRLESWIKIKLAHKEIAEHKEPIPKAVPAEGAE